MPRAIDGVGAPFTDTTPSTISRSSSDASSASAAIRSAFSLARVAARWIADPLITAAREANVPTAYGIRRVSPVTTSTSSNGTPSSSATICAKTVCVALALGGQAGRDLDLAGGLDVHVRALVGPDAGALDVAGQADADLPALRGHLGLERRELVPADQRLDLLQRRRVVAGVVLSCRPSWKISPWS